MNNERGCKLNETTRPDRKKIVNYLFFEGAWNNKIRLDH